MVFFLITSITINQIHGLGSGPHPLVKAPQPGDSETTPAVPDPSHHPPPTVQPLTGRGNTAKCPAQGHNKQTRRLTSTPTLQNTERHAGKLRTPTSKVFWSDSTRVTYSPSTRPRQKRSPRRAGLHPAIQSNLKVLKKLQLVGKKPAPQKATPALIM